MAPSAVTIERVEQNVAPRMGEDAAWTMLSASQYLPHFLVGIGLNVVWPLIGIATGRMPLWLSIAGSVCMLIGFVGTVLLFSTHLVRVRRAARQAYEYLGRPLQCRHGMVPRYVNDEPSNVGQLDGDQRHPAAWRLHVAGGSSLLRDRRAAQGEAGGIPWEVR
ncbi:LapA family protein [Sinomonas sp. G460-2]|uniref:LapA family protein n=1 Tax=Sinomonas sp. G460-2 TaxID=3393464 RepID=UPI0039EE6822